VYDLATEKRGTRLVIRASAALSGAASAIVYPTEISALQHRALGFRGERATVIANGVDVERLRPHPERRDVVRERLGLRPRHVVLGHVARFDPIKNHRGLLRAVAEACTGRDDVRLVLVGPGVEWDNALLRNWLKENKLVDRTLLLGCRDDIADLMAAFDIFCLPSTSEGFPNALAEAGACGLTCVATEVGEAGAILGKDGLLVPAGDHDRLVTALREVMGWSDEQRHEAGERLRSHVVERFSTASMVAAFESLYSAVLAGHNGSGTRNSAAPG
jgi:glycosyltransferase involved in cell wall biosynthesis